MSKYYPAMLDIRGRTAIVIGGDAVAAEKARGLWQSGAHVHVISPEFCAELLQLAEQERCILHARTYETGDLAGAFVVIAATNDAQLIQAIWTETQTRGQLLNVVDVPEYCSFILPSILRREQLTIAVSTEGASPGLAKRIRHSLEERFPPAYGPFLLLANVARTHLRARGATYRQRDDFFSDYYTSQVLASLIAGDSGQAALITAALLQKYGVGVPASDLARALEEEEEYVDRTA
jgi:precorrin-2 dehydrogenase / sirohydrochlorin ferrochelatase